MVSLSCGGQQIVVVRPRRWRSAIVRLWEMPRAAATWLRALPKFQSAQKCVRRNLEIVRLPRVGFYFCVLIGSLAGGSSLHAAQRAIRNNAAVAAAIPQENGATLSGKVADASGKVLAGVTVSVKDASGASQTATTDGKGKYRIVGIAAGTYTISVSAKGYKTFEASDIPLKAGDSIPLDVLLEVGTTEPAASADNSGAAGQPQQQSSSASWYVAPVIPAPPPGVTAILPPTTGQEQPAVTATVVNQDGKTATVTGTVTDQTGAVLSGATVVISNSSGFKQTATSNDRGVYVVSGVPPGTYDLSVSCASVQDFSDFGPHSRSRRHCPTGRLPGNWRRKNRSKRNGRRSSAS